MRVRRPARACAVHREFPRFPRRPPIARWDTMRPMKRRPNTAIRLFAIVLPALPLHAPVALGQAAPAPTGAQAKTPYTATVREDSALVRAAPSV